LEQAENLQVVVRDGQEQPSARLGVPVSIALALSTLRGSDAKANSGAIEASKVYTILPRAEESVAAQ
jgi:hypothetical protein